MAFSPGHRPLTPQAGSLTDVGLGCAPIGNLFSAVDDADSDATLAEALDRGIRFFDTAPHYGAGVSERRLGRLLAHTDRDGLVIATKVGRQIVDGDRAPVGPGGTGVDTIGDLSRDGVLRSLEGSLARLGTDRIDLLYLHDPADVDEALRGAWPALEELKAEGVVRSIGVGMMRNEPLTRFVNEASPDVVMVAGRLTLLDRTAGEVLLPAARRHGVGVIAAGVYNSGILAAPRKSPYFDYHEASPDLRARAIAMEETCLAFGVTLAHAATRFALGHDPVEAIVVGARSLDEVDGLVDGMAAVIPEDLWHALEAIQGPTGSPRATGSSSALA
ncbi:aldo/keto reductase [Herbiconiux sp. P15]|uniref:aldo/keto reductase n=1 Tax=Herbiconiux liukaitaii TaxID=3342799 RepID=UPI0035BA91D0